IEEFSKSTDVSVLTEYNVKEESGNVAEVCTDLLKRDVGVIFLTSYGFTSECKNVIEDNPNVAFYGTSSDVKADNYTAYFVRYYQARYLAGILAGMRSKSGKIGYVAAKKNSQVVRGIDAFTLGVRSVNEKATVYVKWTGSWSDPNAERRAAKNLIEDAGVDFLTYHQNQPNVIDTAEEYGIDSIGYHEAFKGYSEHYLTSIVCNWGALYKELIGDEAAVGASKDMCWIGLEREAVGLSEYSPAVSNNEKLFIEAAKARIISGKDVFTGYIKDNTGVVRSEEGESITDDELMNDIDWFVEGVEIYVK
ncbi:MAG: BMP family ABC transporter substrate-binding protein, partial [Lachnospiraceae bacterium]|nr:BMP family ABC transporter substrate-binding protein [Lachnospiraceae bacterium]